MSSEKEVFMDVSVGGGKKRRSSRKRHVEDASAIITKAEPLAPAPALALAKKPVVILAPPKKKVPKIMLIPKGKPTLKPAIKKTFKAKNVKVIINNTAKTQKQHRSIVEEVDIMTDDQARAAACAAKLSRRETVMKVPITLLRQMLKDYRLMKKMLN